MGGVKVFSMSWCHLNYFTGLLRLATTGSIAVYRHLQFELGLAVLGDREQRVPAYQGFQGIEYHILLDLLLSDDQLAPARLPLFREVVALLELHVQWNREYGLAVNLDLIDELLRLFWSDLFDNLAVGGMAVGRLDLHCFGLNHRVTLHI